MKNTEFKKFYGQKSMVKNTLCITMVVAVTTAVQQTKGHRIGRRVTQSSVECGRKGKVN